MHALNNIPLPYSPNVLEGFFCEVSPTGVL
jgi:hypothetical protein